MELGVKRSSMKQQYHRGDLVYIAKDLGKYRSHFTSDVQAIVLGSYSDFYGGVSGEEYVVFIKGRGSHAWYYASDFTLLERNCSLLPKWEEEVADRVKKESDLDWIFEQGESLLESCPGASAEALAKCLEADLYQGSGEHFVFWGNAQMVLAMALPYLKENDREGWERRCEELRSK